VETLNFILNNLPAIGQRTVQHVSIVEVAQTFLKSQGLI
jgi:hypothetical protein